eukprot:gene12394-16624_t
MNHTVGGLNSNHIRKILSVLQLYLIDSKPCVEPSTNNAKDPPNLTIDEKILFLLHNSVCLIDSLTTVTLKEMFSIRRDILYWEQLTGCNKFERSFYQINSVVYKNLVSRLPNSNKCENKNELIFASIKNIESHVYSLKSDFDNLAVLLSTINQAASNLKLIYLDFNDENYLGDYAQNRDECKDEIRRIAVSKISVCISRLYRYFYPLSSGILTEIVNDESFLDVIDLSLSRMDALTMLMEKIGENKNEQYPLTFTQNRTPRPSNNERYWLRNIVLIGGGLYLTKLLVSMSISYELQTMIKLATDYLKNAIKERIIEPITDLKNELLNTIRRRDGMVSREDLDQSRKALERMLDDFSKTATGSSKILSYMTSIGGSSYRNSNPPNLQSPPLTITQEQAMDTLMHSYEKELQSPIRGILFGSLMTAMLIQMQKLKVHTEAAMLTMDQILASNELTIACTAAMPAVVVLGTIVYYSYRALFSRRSSLSGTITAHFRLILADVERSLNEQKDLLSAQDNKQLNTSEIYTKLAPILQVVHKNSTSDDDSTSWDKFRDYCTQLLSPAPGSNKAKALANSNDIDDEKGIITSNDNIVVEKKNMKKDSFSSVGQSIISSLKLDNPKISNEFLDDHTEQVKRMKYRQIHHSRRRYQVSSGMLYFNMYRLHEEFERLFAPNHYLLYNKSPLESEFLSLRKGEAVKRVQINHSSVPLLLPTLSNMTTPLDVQIATLAHLSIPLPHVGRRGLLLSFYGMIVNSNELSFTTEYNSMRKDISILQGASDAEVSIHQQLHTAQRMRKSYKCFLA